MDKEVFVDIVGYEGKYQVSNLGNVKSLNYFGLGGVQLMKQSKTGRGYFSIEFSLNNKQKSIGVHRLVATAFIDNPLGKPYINHKNGIKTDNRVENLEWCTQSENVSHGFKVLGRVISEETKKKISNTKRQKNIIN